MAVTASQLVEGVDVCGKNQRGDPRQRNKPENPIALKSGEGVGHGRDLSFREQLFPVARKCLHQRQGGLDDVLCNAPSLHKIHDRKEKKGLVGRLMGGAGAPPLGVFVGAELGEFVGPVSGHVAPGVGDELLKSLGSFKSRYQREVNKKAYGVCLEGGDHSI